MQAALLQKLKSQVGSEKMFNLMMDLLKPESGKSAGSSHVAEPGIGGGQAFKTEALPSYARWAHLCKMELLKGKFCESGSQSNLWGAVLRIRDVVSRIRFPSIFSSWILDPT
jgi:hypothetical protein